MFQLSILLWSEDVVDNCDENLEHEIWAPHKFLNQFGVEMNEGSSCHLYEVALDYCVEAHGYLWCGSKSKWLTVCGVCRIWGEHGQAALERARVCILNCGPTGSEALKNLVLGGIGSFTIVDASKVSQSDLGNNYLGELLANVLDFFI